MSLGKHKYYCEMCRKQCKDDNAFQQHKRSSQHQHHMIEFNENPDLYLARFSQEVQDGFLEVLKVKFGYSSFTPLNKVYNEYIRDPYHTHLNSTKWASLSEFAAALESQGLVDLTREMDQSGTEQIHVRLIDKDRDKREALAHLSSKEFRRDLERKREEKELEKRIKQTAKLFKQHDAKQEHDQEEAKTIVSRESKPVAVRPTQKVFGGTEEVEDLQLLQKQKRTNLDKIIQQEKAAQWARPGLVVKVKADKAKGEIIKVHSGLRVTVKLQDEIRDLSEAELSKVLPSEGGKIYVFSLGKTGTLSQLDLKAGLAVVQLGQTVRVKFDDVCKINS